MYCCMIDKLIWLGGLVYEVIEYVFVEEILKFVVSEWFVVGGEICEYFLEDYEIVEFLIVVCFFGEKIIWDDVSYSIIKGLGKIFLLLIIVV